MAKHIAMAWLHSILEHRAVFVPLRKAYSARRRLFRSLGRLTGWYSGRRVLAAEAVNARLREALSTGRPYMVGRLGSAELDAMCIAAGMERRSRSEDWWGRYRRELRGDRDSWPESNRFQLSNNAGFFPTTEDNLQRYVALMRADLGVADLLGVWFYLGEAETLGEYAPEATLASPLGLEPYYFDHPWSRALEGRRVLVVHPFSESIRGQYQRRTKLFAKADVLPAFELTTIPAVQSIAGNSCGYASWFDALDAMCEKIASTRFDVAIIGAGAYGLPLAAFCKRLGRQAIHLGGPTQVLFGIRGRRWDTRPEVASLYNEFWIRPSAEETPVGHIKVEEGTYW